MSITKPFIGGYHEDTQLKCLTSTLLLTFIIIYLSKNNKTKKLQLRVKPGTMRQGFTLLFIRKNEQNCISRINHDFSTFKNIML